MGNFALTDTLKHHSEVLINTLYQHSINISIDTRSSFGQLSHTHMYQPTLDRMSAKISQLSTPIVNWVVDLLLKSIDGGIS